MYCSWCYEQTEADTCEKCGNDPHLIDRFVLEESLGHGATGQTWRATDEQGDVVAIKELSFRRIADLKQLDLFAREARVLQSLDHPGIPKYYEDFAVEDDKHVGLYLVQEFIDGEALDALSVTDEETVMEVMRSIWDILEYLKTRRPPVVHRDIKPSNIMKRSDGSYVLIDFGSTRAAVGATGNTVAGTLGYMAPEQLMGKATPASDVYGLGATAVSLLANQDASDLVDPHKPGSWRDRVTVSDSLGDLLVAMLAVDPDERPSRFSIENDRDSIDKNEPKQDRASLALAERGELLAPPDLDADDDWDSDWDDDSDEWQPDWEETNAIVPFDEKRNALVVAEGRFAILEYFAQPFKNTKGVVLTFAIGAVITAIIAVLIPTSGITVWNAWIVWPLISTLSIFPFHVIAKAILGRDD